MFGPNFGGAAAMAAAAAADIVRTGLPPAVLAAGAELLEQHEIAELLVGHIEEFLRAAWRLLYDIGRDLPGDEKTGG